MKEWSFEFQEMIKCFPELEALENIEQNPIYHGEGNVLNHTRNVCEAIKQCKEWQGLTYKEQMILYFAGAFHDIGKTVCTKVIDGQIVSPKHAIIGTKIFRSLIYRVYAKTYEIDFEIREQIGALIRYHGLPLLFMEKQDITYEVLRASECVNMKLLYLLAKADLVGRICEDRDVLLEGIDYFKEYAIELGCYNHPMPFSNDYTRFLYLNKNRIWHGDEVYDCRTFKVIIMAGLPLAGKDTYIEENFKGIPVISLDDIREEFKISPKEGSKKVVAIAKERAKVYLRNKQSFIWNATNILKETRMKLCELFNDYDAKVEYVYVEVPYESLQKRYKKRERIVPMSVIHRMIDKMEIVEKWEGNEVKYILKK